MIKMFLWKTMRALQTILALVISFSFLRIESACKADFQKSVRKRIYYSRSVEYFFAQDFIEVS